MTGWPFPLPLPCQLQAAASACLSKTYLRANVGAPSPHGAISIWGRLRIGVLSSPSIIPRAFFPTQLIAALTLASANQRRRIANCKWLVFRLLSPARGCLAVLRQKTVSEQRLQDSATPTER